MTSSASNVISVEQKPVLVVGAIELRQTFYMFLRVLERRESGVSEEFWNVEEASVVLRKIHVFSVMPESHR